MRNWTYPAFDFHVSSISTYYSFALDSHLRIHANHSMIETRQQGFGFETISYQKTLSISYPNSDPTP